MFISFFFSMRFLKSNFLARLVNSYVVDSPQPANISYLWNFGSLLATCLIIQILTGVFLAMHYQPHVDFAFNSVEHISLFIYFMYAYLLFKVIVFKNYVLHILLKLRSIFSFKFRYYYWINIRLKNKSSYSTKNTYNYT